MDEVSISPRARVVIVSFYIWWAEKQTNTAASHHRLGLRYSAAAAVD